MSAVLPDWRPFHPAAVTEEPSALLSEFSLVDRMPDGAEYWENDKYQVTVRRSDEDPVFGSRGGMIQLGVSSADGTARHDWREFQQMLDPSNYYTLWCFPTGRIKVGKRSGRRVFTATDAVAPQRDFKK